MSQADEALQRIHPSVWIAPGAQLYGRIEVGAGSSLWPHCVIRCECVNAVVMNRAVIGHGSIVAPGAVVTEGRDRASE